MSSLQNKVIVVTGACGDIGTEIVKLFAKRKANLVLVDLDAGVLKNTAALCKAVENVEVLTVEADLTVREQLESVVEKTLSHFKRVDVLVNNAAICLEKKISETSWEDFDKTLNTNLKAPYFLTKAFLPELIKTKGTIVNTSSGAAKKGVPRLSSYSLSKAGLDNLTSIVAQETVRFGVRTNSLNLSVVDTKMAGTEENPSPGRVMANVMQPLCGLIKPEQAASWIVHLASEESGPITGQCLSVDGGSSVAGLPPDYVPAKTK